MRFVLCALTCAAAACAAFDQSPPSIETPAARASVASPSFTDPRQYNSYDFCNSPLGLFEREKSLVQVNLSYRSLALHSASPGDSLRRSSLAWNVPDILIGNPKYAYFRVNYSPTTIADNTLSGPNRTLPLKRFGIAIASQMPSGIFQVGLRGKGYLGEEALAGSRNSRIIMGLEDLSLVLGSRIQEIVAIGIFGGATAKLDTLRDLDNPSGTPPRTSVPDRYFTGQIPVVGCYADFGKEGFPLSSDFSWQTATHRFIGVAGMGALRDQDPIKGDSLAWRWQAIGDIRTSGCALRPALFLGYWRNRYQAYDTAAGNSSLSVGPRRDGKDWKMSDFSFGLGTSVTLAQFATTWIEFAHSAMGLHYGAAWPDSSDRNQGYNRFSIGVEANVHALPFLHFPSSVETFVRLGYFSLSDNGGINGFQSEDFGLLTAAIPPSQAYRSTPTFGWGPDERVSGFTFGLGGTFFDKRIQTDAHMALLSRSLEKDYRGVEFGVDCAYTLR